MLLWTRRRLVKQRHTKALESGWPWPILRGPATLPTHTTFCSRAELLPSQPFTHIKALFHPVGTLTFAFCWIQRFCFNTTGFFFFKGLLLRSHIHYHNQHGPLSCEGYSTNSLLKATQGFTHFSQAFSRHGCFSPAFDAQVPYYAFNPLFSLD